MSKEYTKNFPKLASIDNCFGCMLCHDLCPVNAITMKEDDNGFWLPNIDQNTCIGCLSCERGCAKIQSSHPNNVANKPLKGFCDNLEIRSKSASGGVFAAIARYLISKYGAVIVGATLMQNKVQHIVIEDITGISKLQGSKYIQSDTSNIYCEVKKYLTAGRMVLFSGTPCQIEALNVFLRKPFDNLLTIDLICHGVVSNRLFKRHNEINRIDEVVAFRDKSLGWGKDVFFRYKANGSEQVDTNWTNNFFYHAFQLETCCRPNCYKCIFSQQHRVSDITIGDYWADRNSRNYNSLGVSSILPNTSKGRRIVEECDMLEVYKTDWESTIRPNPRLFTSRPEFLKFSCSKHISSLYKYLPAKIVDCILGTRFSKRHILFRPWFLYINKTKQRYEKRYKAELTKFLKSKHPL